MIRAMVVATLLFAARAASAQPMMVDPKQMSGIPRPDPQVPAGTITVRLIRGELANRMIGQEVELSDGGKYSSKQKTDDAGRATFSGLTGGPFQARATDADGNVMTSQPMELPAGMGVRVMLVFPLAGAPESSRPSTSPDGAMKADGVGRSDKALKPGVIVVRAVDGEGKPLAGLDVVLGHARAGEQQVRELKGKTDANGEATFDNQDSKPTSGYLAEVVKDGSRYAGKPFKLTENMGVRVVLEVRPVSKDVSNLQIGQGSHFIFEVTDDAVQVVEVWRLQNSGTTAIDVPGGLHIPLPDKALSAAVGPQMPPSFSVSGHEAVWKGPLPPGDTELQVMFVLTYDSDTVELRQSTPIPFTETNVVTEKIDGMSVDGPGIQSEERQLQGRRLMLYRGPAAPKGGEIVLTINGLPHSTAIWRYLAAAMSLIILFGFGVYAVASPKVEGGALEKLEQRREHLLEELAALDQKMKGAAADPKTQKKRDELTDKLAKIYKEIDEVAA